MQAVKSEATALKRSKAGIRSYFNWCTEPGSIAKALYGDVNFPESPVQKHRNRIVEGLVVLVHEQSEAMGRQKLEPLLYDTLLRAIEHLGYGMSAAESSSEGEVKRRIKIAERILLSALAEPSEVATLPPLSAVAID